MAAQVLSLEKENASFFLHGQMQASPYFFLEPYIYQGEQGNLSEAGNTAKTTVL